MQYQKRNGVDMKGVAKDESNSLGKGLIDLEKSRDEVVGEVMKAPKRRIDNVITRLADSVHVVQMHAIMLESIRTQYSRQLWAHRAMATGLATGGMGLVFGGLYLGLSIQPVALLSVLYTGLSGGFVYYNSTLLTKLEVDLTDTEGLSALFRKLYARPLAEGDEFVTSLWKRTLGPLQLALATQGLASLPKVGKGMTTPPGLSTWKGARSSCNLERSAWASRPPLRPWC